MDDKNNDLTQRRSEEILTAAKRIFARKGFRRTKIDEIAEYLNVAKGTIYRYFSDKETLFIAVFEHGMAKLQKKFKTDVRPIADPQAKVKAAVRTYFEFFEEDRELIEIQMQVRSEFKEQYKRIFLEMYSDYIVRIQENLRNGIKMGVFRELDVEKTAETMSALLGGVLQTFYIRDFGPATGAPSPQKLTDRTEAVTAFILQGLLKKDTQ